MVLHLMVEPNTCPMTAASGETANFNVAVVLWLFNSTCDKDPVRAFGSLS